MRPFFIATLLLFLGGVAISAQPSGSRVDEVVGVYGSGHNFGFSTLELKSDGTYVQNSSDCTQEWFESGTYQISDNYIHFKILKFTRGGHGDGPVSDLLDTETQKKLDPSFREVVREYRWMLVRWSERLYLIPENDLKNFVNAVNLSLEPRPEWSSEPYYGAFFLRAKDESKKVRGVPELPADWRGLLLRKPVRSKVIAVRDPAGDTMATINRGSINGLKVGMRLIGKDEEPSPWAISEVVSVAKRSAKVRVASSVKIGDQLSTAFVRRDFYRR